jgi:hypothetical protein
MAFNKPAQKGKYEHKPNRGSMFENDDKQKETQPDLKGSINVKGTVYWINGWKDITQNGKHVLKLSLQEQEERDDLPETRPAQRTQQRSKW